MSITQGVCNIFFSDLMKGLYDLTTGTAQDFKCALYTSDAELGPTTSAYTATNEVSGTGYTAGGVSLTVANLTGGASYPVAFMDFDDATWAGSTITARGALVYNNTLAGKNAMFTLDFGSDRSSSSSTFRVKFPGDNASDAILRLTAP